jgi:hypothetical protein
MNRKWDKRDSESVKAYQAFCDYRDMGTGRSLRALLDQYIKQVSNKPPTTKWSTISTWSHKHEWQKRVSAWQIEQQHIKDEYNAELRLEQRGQRQKITIALNGMLAKVMNAENQKTLKPSELNSIATAAAKILDQSRQEFNDLPTHRNENREITWQDKTIAYIKAGEIGYKELAEEFDIDLATKLFTLAGVEITES